MEIEITVKLKEGDQEGTMHWECNAEDTVLRERIARIVMTAIMEVKPNLLPMTIYHGPFLRLSDLLKPLDSEGTDQR